MRYPLTNRALRAFAVFAAVSLMATACDDDDPIPEEEPTTTRIVLTIGTGAGVQTVTWNTLNATLTPATITIPVGQSRAVTAQFFRADNSVDPVVIEADFRLDFAVTGTAITTAKTSNLAGTFTAGGTAGQSTVVMTIVHLAAGHPEYVSTALTVTVQ